MGSFDTISYGREALAPYACNAAHSRGRLYEEPISPTRTPFQRDRDRIIHSTAFRRLKHKTQVFVHHVGDHYRTRLTHSIEVSQIARSLARALRVDEDLAECLALSHDFGHTPFGHAGEDALDAVMQNQGGFDHNAQSLRIVTKLEQQYAEFDGLNLSWETLEGLVKHNGPITGDDIPQSILNFNKHFNLELETHSSIEAQCAAVADDIAYNAHDLDDGLRAGLFELDQVESLPLAGDAMMTIRTKYPDLDDARTRHEIVRRQITSMVEDVIQTALENLDRIAPSTDKEVRHAGQAIVCFSSEMAEKERTIKAFLFENMYRSAALLNMREGAEKIIQDLYAIYQGDPASLPAGLNHTLSEIPQEKYPRTLSDFIAGMTDSYAIAEHRRLFDVTPDLG